MVWVSCYIVRSLGLGFCDYPKPFNVRSLGLAVSIFQGSTNIPALFLGSWRLRASGLGFLGSGFSMLGFRV